MIDSIKVSEVTDVVTPAEETYPPNYNFSMESTWEEQTFSAGGEGGITPTGTKNIATNGDHDVTQYATAHVDVPTGITPSGSQTFTENGTYDVTNLAEAVVNVTSSGGSDEWKSNVNKVTLGFQNATITDDLDIDLSGVDVSLTNFLRSATASKSDTSVRIKCNSINTFGNHLQGESKITTLIIDTVVNPVMGSQAFHTNQIKRILGTPWNCTSLNGTNNYRYFLCSSLTEIYMLPNRITDGGTLTTGVLVDDSLVSIANALKEGLATAQTMTIQNTSTKSKCSTITGTVTEVTEGSDTYHMFTIDENGSTTLIDFMTNTKGWTIA